MPRRSGLGVGLGVLAFLLTWMMLTVWAKDFWKEKPFTKWNESEALMMLSNSPWAKTQTVPGDYGKAFLPRFIDTSTAGGAVRTPPLAPTQGYGGDNSTPLYIRWHSSIMIRQAIGQLGLLRKVYSEESARHFIEQPMPDLVVSISGPVMEPFEALSLEDLKPITFLLSKTDKGKKTGLREYLSPKQTKDGSALFLFPRLVDGAPCVVAADDEAQFVTRVGKLKIQAVFKLAQMSVSGKLDI